MKNLFLIFLITYSFSLTAYSQIVWAPQSAKWTYNGQGQTTSYIEIEYVKDTTVLGKQSKVLKKTRFTYGSLTNEIDTSSLGNEITYEKDGVVYLYSYGSFDTLYSFNTNIGNSWALNCGHDTTNCSATVTDTGTLTINGQNLNFIAVEYDFGYLFPSKVNDTIIERIGTTNLYFLPCEIIAGLLDGNEGSKLRCYSDNEIGTYSNNFNKPCDFLTSIGNYIEDTTLKVYPVPCSETLNIAFKKCKDRHIKIIDLTGKVWISKKTNDLKCTVSLNMVPNGILILSISTANGIIHKKILKH